MLLYAEPRSTYRSSSQSIIPRNGLVEKAVKNYALILILRKRKKKKKIGERKGPRIIFEDTRGIKAEYVIAIPIQFREFEQSYCVDIESKVGMVGSMLATVVPSTVETPRMNVVVHFLSNKAVGTISTGRRNQTARATGSYCVRRPCT